MIAYPDTSFLCALYRQQANSQQAAACFEAMPEALHVTGLLLYEFRQSARFQVWLHSQDKTKGYSRVEGEAALADLQSDIDTGILVIAAADWPDVHRLAETLSKSRTQSAGHRAFDVLHVATALHLGAREFLTFDSKQRKLATDQGLKARPEF